MSNPKAVTVSDIVEMDADFDRWIKQQQLKGLCTLLSSGIFDPLDQAVFTDNKSANISHYRSLVLIERTKEERRELRAAYKIQVEDSKGSRVNPDKMPETNSESEHFCQIKRERAEEQDFPNNQKKGKLDDPNHRAKLLQKLANDMKKNGIASTDEITGFYEKLIEKSTEEELDEIFISKILQSRFSSA